MAKRNRHIANTVADPTLKSTEVEIQGKKYTLCFDLGAMAEAELHFRRQGEDVNLLMAFPEMTLSSMRMIFPCAVRKFHPELSFKQAQELVDIRTAYAIAPFVLQAWQQALPAPDKEAGKPETPPEP